MSRRRGRKSNQDLVSTIKRICLKCDKQFPSISSINRLCLTCKITITNERSQYD
jgi:hypothetical protein